MPLPEPGAPKSRIRSGFIGVGLNFLLNFFSTYLYTHSSSESIILLLFRVFSSSSSSSECLRYLAAPSSLSWVSLFVPRSNSSSSSYSSISSSSPATKSSFSSYPHPHRFVQTFHMNFLVLWDYRFSPTSLPVIFLDSICRFIFMALRTSSSQVAASPTDQHR